MRRHLRSRPARAGFTLAEMLMSIAIITVLIALSAAAVLRFMNVGPYHATVANLNKLKGALDTQWQAVRDKAMREPMQAGFSTNPAGAGEREKYVNAKLMQAFPISFVELINDVPGTPIKAWPPYVNYLNTTLKITKLSEAQAVPPDIQQAICLMMILERGPSNAGLNAGQLGTSMVIRLRLPNAVEADGCVDAWGRGLYFSRQFEDKANTLGIVSAGANAKLGAVINLNDAAKHTLKVTGIQDADDNIMVPDNR